MTHQVNHADVDAKFQGGGGNANLDLPLLQLFFCRQARGAREAAVVGHHCFLPHPQRELMGHSFHQTARIDKHQRGAVPGGQTRHRIQRFTPNLVGGDGTQFPPKELHRQIHASGVARIRDETIGTAVAGDIPVSHQEPGNLIDGALRGRQTHPHDGSPGQGAQPLHGQRKVRSALVIDNCVNFVEDYGLHVGKPTTSAFRGQQNVERFRRRYQDVRRLFRHPLSLRSRRITSSHSRPHGR